MATLEWWETAVFSGSQLRENKLVEVNQIIDSTNDFVSGHKLH